MVTLDFAIVQYGHLLLLPPVDLHAYQNLAVLVPTPVYASGSYYCNCLISLTILQTQQYKIGKGFLLFYENHVEN